MIQFFEEGIVRIPFYTWENWGVEDPTTYEWLTQICLSLVPPNLNW